MIPVAQAISLWMAPNSPHRLTACLTLLCLPALAQERVDPKLSIPDVRGRMQRPFDPQGKTASVVFFITNDCPISNRYAPEIKRICSDFASNARCYLDYVDPDLTAEQILKHTAEFGHGDYPAIRDARQLLVKAAGATVTPEVAVILPGGKIGYRGRIDNTYVTWGQARREATEKDLRTALDAAVAGRPAATPRTKAIGCYIPPPDIRK